MVSTVPLTFSGFPRLAQPSVHMCVVLSHRDIRTAKCTREFRELKPNVQQGLCQQRPGPLQRLGAPEMSDGWTGWQHQGVSVCGPKRSSWNPSPVEPRKCSEITGEKSRPVTQSGRGKSPGVEQLPADVLLLFEREGLLGKSLLILLFVYYVCIYTCS